MVVYVGACKQCPIKLMHSVEEYIESLNRVAVCVCL